MPLAKQFSGVLRPPLVVLHGYKEFFFCSDEDLKKDPNTQCEALTDALTDLAKYCQDKRVEFPKNIFVQADNCPRELRNQFTLLWAVAMLLLCPALHSIAFNFLRKGHTHEDIGHAELHACSITAQLAHSSMYLHRCLHVCMFLYSRSALRQNRVDLGGVFAFGHTRPFHGCDKEGFGGCATTGSQPSCWTTRQDTGLGEMGGKPRGGDIWVHKSKVLAQYAADTAKRLPCLLLSCNM